MSAIPEDQIFSSIQDRGRTWWARGGEEAVQRGLARGAGTGSSPPGCEAGAFQEADGREPNAIESAMGAEGTDGVVRARGRETTAASGSEENGQRGRERALIETHEQNESGGRQTDEARNEKLGGRSDMGRGFGGGGELATGLQEIFSSSAKGRS